MPIYTTVIAPSRIVNAVQTFQAHCKSFFVAIKSSFVASSAKWSSKMSDNALALAHAGARVECNLNASRSYSVPRKRLNDSARCLCIAIHKRRYGAVKFRRRSAAIGQSAVGQPCATRQRECIDTGCSRPNMAERVRGARRPHVGAELQATEPGFGRADAAPVAAQSPPRQIHNFLNIFVVAAGLGGGVLREPGKASGRWIGQNKGPANRGGYARQAVARCGGAVARGRMVGAVAPMGGHRARRRHAGREQ
jgi:hypothetical protein